VDLMKDLQAFSLLTTAITATWAGCVAAVTFQDSVKWKRANAADSLIKEMQSNPNSSKGILIFDWLYHDIEALHKIRTYKEIINVVEKFTKNDGSAKKFTKEEIDLLRDIDWFFYYIDRIEQSIRNKFFYFNHVQWIFIPYYFKIKGDMEVFDSFSEKKGYFLAPLFWRRYAKEQFWLDDTGQRSWLSGYRLWPSARKPIAMPRIKHLEPSVSRAGDAPESSV
jgi:hypothetical protein